MLVATLAVGASFLPVLVGLRHTDWRQRVWWWLAVVAIGNLVIGELVTGPTWVWTWYAYPVTLWLGVRALVALPGMEGHRAHAWPLVLLFLGVWLSAPFFGDRQGGYSVFVAPFHALLLSGGSGWAMLRGTMAESHPKTLLVGAATFLTYGPFVALWPVSAWLSATQPEWVLPVWEARAGLLVVGSVLYALALR